MAALHGWIGLLAGWLLFVVFVFGTTAFFRSEISLWMRPELERIAVSPASLDAAGTWLRSQAPMAKSWRITLPMKGGAIAVSWDGAVDGGGRAMLDPATHRQVHPRDTSGGDFLYGFHYELHYMPWRLARVIVGVATVALLVVLLSGVITHKKIFSDFFLLRFGKGQRSWLDTHNVTGVLALPFHLMITYTGLVALLFTLMPWAISANFPSRGAFNEAAYPSGPKVEASGKAAPMLPLSLLLASAGEAWKGRLPAYISISHPGDAAAVVEIHPEDNHLGVDHPTIRLSGITGKPVGMPAALSGPALASQVVMVQLHRGAFAGPILRWLYFLSGGTGTMMIASGLVLWTVKRRAKLPDPDRPHFGFKLVERLNIGVIAGAPAGIAVYFLANRLLPLGLGHRADWEINSLFIAWGGLFVWTIARPAKRAWIEALAACTLLYAAVPIVSAVTTTRGLIPSLMARDWVFVGFDLTMLATAAGCAFAAWKVGTHRPKSAPPRKLRELAGAAV